MTIHTKLVLSDGLRKVFLYGDKHCEKNGEDLSEATELMNQIEKLLEKGGNVFIEFGAYQMQKVLEDEGQIGLYYKIPYLLRDYYRSKDHRVCINDVRTTTTLAPFVSWCKYSVNPEATTIVTWRNIQERFDDRKIALIP
jgi:hypothetical protein